VPEAMKPRRIAIEVANDNQQIEQKQAAWGTSVPGRRTTCARHGPRAGELRPV